MRKIFLVAIAIISGMCSCSNEAESVSRSFVENGNSSEIVAANSLEELCRIMEIPESESSVRKIRTRAAEEEVEGELITLTGFDGIENKVNKKVLLKGDAASKFGLPSGIYVLQSGRYTKTVNIQGKDFYEGTEDEMKTCGYMPQTSAHGEIDGTYSEQRGYSYDYQTNYVVLKTYVIKVLSDAYGQSTGERCAPCKPSELKWTFVLVSL